MPKASLLFALPAAFFLFALPAFAQTDACQSVPAHDATPAETAYQHSHFETADSLYQQELAGKPDDPDLNAALVRTQLREGRFADAATRAERIATSSPHSAAALTALAEVQIRQGQPWLALKSLDAAAAADPCYARTHLIRSRIDRIDSMYAAERSELDAANRIDPADYDIHRAWAHTVNPANDIVRIQESLATTKDLDPEIRQKAEASAKGMLSLLSENSQTCQSPSLTAPVTLPLLPAYENVKEVTAYKLDVQLAQTKAKLIVDTAASGLYISHALAEANGLEHAEGAPAGTVQAKSIKVGPLEFHDCMVGVSDTPFSPGVEGFIGSDIFASYLVTLDFPESKVVLAPLPPPPPAIQSTLPGDRYTGPEVQGYSPVYHKAQYLMVPVMLNKKDQRLFVLDSGIRFSTMTSQVAHSISNTRLNFTNAVKTVSGSTLQIYRDSFDLQFANLSLDRRDHILELDPTSVEESAGMQVGGLLGFDILHSLRMHIDYRDGLVQFESPNGGPNQQRASAVAPGPAMPQPANTASAPACPSFADQDKSKPLSTAIRGSITGRIDSAKLAPGQEIQVKVKADWISDSCKLFKGAALYGHVLEAKAAKGNSDLAINFDEADCSGHPRQKLALRVVALRDASASAAVHNATPTEVSGGSRAISSAAGAMGSQSDDDMVSGAATYHPGMVDGLSHIRIVPEGGPQCSAMVTSQDRSVYLGTGTEFVITMQAQPE